MKREPKFGILKQVKYTPKVYKWIQISTMRKSTLSYRQKRNIKSSNFDSTLVNYIKSRNFRVLLSSGENITESRTFGKAERKCRLSLGSELRLSCHSALSVRLFIFGNPFLGLTLQFQYSILTYITMYRLQFQEPGHYLRAFGSQNRKIPSEYNIKLFGKNPTH